METITRNAMLNRWHRMAEANVTGAWDIYSFLKGAIEYAGDDEEGLRDPWEDEDYCNNKVTGIVDGYLYAFRARYENQDGGTGDFMIWHTHGVWCVELSEAAFEDLERMMFNSKVGGYLYADLDQSTIPTYGQVWAQMNSPAVTPHKTRRRGRKTA